MSGGSGKPAGSVCGAALSLTTPVYSKCQSTGHSVFLKSVFQKLLAQVWAGGRLGDCPRPLSQPALP